MCWFLPYLSSSNLFELNCMLFVSCHLYIVFRSSCSVLTSSSSVIERRTLVSSAKEETWLLVFSFMSPIRMRNSIGPKTVPWGTLLITWDIVEVAPFAVIYWVLSLRKLWIQSPLSHQYQVFSVCGIGYHGPPCQMLLQSRGI